MHSVAQSMTLDLDLPDIGRPEPTKFKRQEKTPALMKAMMLEAYDIYVSDDFQRKLRQIESIHGKAYEKKGCSPELMRLIRSTQVELFSRYGWDGSEETLADFDSATRTTKELIRLRHINNLLLGVVPGRRIDLYATAAAGLL